MHAVARLVFFGYIDNIQVSWVKMGREGVLACLNAGVNDLGGTLMNESITRAAGAAHGQEWSPTDIEALIADAGRSSRLRTTRYDDADPGLLIKAFNALALVEVVNEGAGRLQRDKRLQPTAVEVIQSDGLLAQAEQVVLMAACD